MMRKILILFIVLLIFLYSIFRVPDIAYSMLSSEKKYIQNIATFIIKNPMFNQLSLINGSSDEIFYLHVMLDSSKKSINENEHLLKLICYKIENYTRQKNDRYHFTIKNNFIILLGNSIVEESQEIALVWLHRKLVTKNWLDEKNPLGKKSINEYIETYKNYNYKYGKTNEVINIIDDFKKINTSKFKVKYPDPCMEQTNV